MPHVLPRFRPSLGTALARSRVALAVIGLLAVASGRVLGDSTPQTIPFSQNWTNTGLITTNDSWSGVPGIIGYRGDGLASGTGADPQLVVGEGTPVVDVNANQSNPNSFTTGGVTEFELADPVVALAGSGTAKAPYILIHLNTTGVSGLTVAYRLRDLESGADNAIAKVALQYRVGSTGNFTNLPLGYVADATTGPSTAGPDTPVSVALPAACDNQPLVQVRVITTDAAGNDEWVGIDDISVTTSGPVNAPVLATCPSPLTGSAGVATSEGVSASDADGTVTAVTISSITPSDPGTISLTGFAPAGAVGGTATATLSVGAATPYGSYTVNILWSNNDSPTPQTGSCAVVVNLAPGPQEIWQIQGSGTASPFAGQTITTLDNIVTAIAYSSGGVANGFFMQTPDARKDADANNTSNGIFVFTGSVPTVSVGDQVDVTGQVVEFFNMTEYTNTGLVVTVDSSGNPLPAAVEWDASTPSPLQPQSPVEYERFEGMLIHIATGRTTAPKDSHGNLAVVAKATRSFREPGVEIPRPACVPVTVPEWDANPEMFLVEPDRAGQPDLSPAAGSTVSLTGALIYDFGFWEIWPTQYSISSPALPRPVRARNPGEFTVAAQNMERYFDDVDDPADPDGRNEDPDEVLPTAVYQDRITKFSEQIRVVLGAPDILALEEAEKLEVLQTLAARIHADDPSLSYTAYLEEGHDPGQIDTGFLVRDTVQVDAVTQLGYLEQGSYDSPADNLHDRPPLLLEGKYIGNGQPFPIKVLAIHNKALSSSEGCGTTAKRNRQKRLTQAISVANMIQSIQTANPGVRLAVVGDFNMFHFSDGYVDGTGIMRGVYNPALNERSPGVPGFPGEPAYTQPNPVLTNQVDLLPAAEQYSFTFSAAVDGPGMGQTLDQCLTTQTLTNTFARGMQYSRGNTDVEEAPNHLNAAAGALRCSDHDGFVLFVMSDRDADGIPDDLDVDDVAIAKVAVPNPSVYAGANLSYTVNLTKSGAGSLPNVTFTDVLPAETRFMSLDSVSSGWSCTVPAVNTNGTITCTKAAMTGPETAMISFTVRVCSDTLCGATVTNTATVATVPPDYSAANDSAAVARTVGTRADIGVTMAAPGTVSAGGTFTYSLAATNYGPSDAEAALSATLPAGWTIQSATPSQGSCVGQGTSSLGCDFGILAGPASCAGAPNIATVQVVATVPLTAPTGPYSSSATVISKTCDGDPVPGNDTASVTSNVTILSDLSLAKTVNPSSVSSNRDLGYSLTVNNQGPSQAYGVVVTDPLPAELRFRAVRAPAGWSCTTPYVGGRGTVRCTAPSPLNPGTYTIGITAIAPPVCNRNVVITNTATVAAASADPDMSSNQASVNVLVVGGPCFGLSRAEE